jgi:hypothetical protein
MKQIIQSTLITLLLLQATASLNAQQTFLTAVPSEGSLSTFIPSDTYIQPKGGWASNFQNNASEGPIALSYDRDMTTLYHSSWNNTVFPVTLDYYFADTVEQIDYLVYYPRSSGNNGNFKTVEVWYAANGQPLTKYGDFDFQGEGVPRTVTFEPALVRPDTIRFVVKSGAGDNSTGFASCAEMEFYRENSNKFDYSAIFTDETCSALKPGITLDDINAINTGFYKKLASDIYHGFYDPEFRVQEYRAWQHPNKQAAINKTAQYSLRDNPTGIYVSQGEDLVVFVGDTHEQGISLLTQDLPTGGFDSRSYPLKRGLNKIRIAAKGLIYIQYYDDSGADAPRIKINFVTGAVNGYFDSQKHQASDWSRLINNAVATDFDVLGEFAHLTFPVANFKKLTDGKAYIDNWDQLVVYEHEFMGLYKYPELKFKNRMYCHADHNPQAAYMYATSYRTGYSPGTWNELTSQNWHHGSVVWGPAHEIGHVNQIRPGMKWLGMTEVSNNIYSLHVQTSFGNTSRLVTDGVYSSAFNKYEGKNIAHQNFGYVGKNDDGKDEWKSDLFEQLVPFWQLKLYLHDVLGKTDFYPDLLHYYMVNPDPTEPATDGRYQLYFVRIACEIAQLDLTEFFGKWGFLTPINKTITDYGTGEFVITQQQIDDLKAEITAKNYPKPPRDFSRITDSNKDTYK